MRPDLTYDAQAGATYLTLAPGVAVAQTKDLAPGVHADYAANGSLVGIEVLLPPKPRPTLDDLMREMDLRARDMHTREEGRRNDICGADERVLAVAEDAMRLVKALRYATQAMRVQLAGATPVIEADIHSVAGYLRGDA